MKLESQLRDACWQEAEHNAACCADALNRCGEPIARHFARRFDLAMEYWRLAVFAD